MTRLFMDLADELCNGKLVLELEGGYNLKTLPTTHEVIVQQLTGIDYGEPIVGEVLDSTKDLLVELNNNLKATKIWPEAPDYGETNTDNNRTCRP
jgi:acetoin utilization deacetylase AcuC-like enzyme